ncbi:hypothetical protein ACFXJ5_37275 [Streptomyces sp. NPDC059373]
MRSDTNTDTGTGTEQAGNEPLALELLVHGVGGTTPQAMLNDPRITRVSGDDTAGIYRRTEDADAERRPAAYQGKPVPDAYSWCNLTSGDGSRALWLLLLPFMVANLAHWMRPPSNSAGLRRTYEVLLRLVSLSLTVLLVAGACEVAMDLVAWQCAGVPVCASSKSWLGFLPAGEPGLRLVIGAVVPVVLTGLLWWLSRRTWYAYESQKPLPTGAGDRRHDDPASPLALPGFWFGRRLVARLRAAHTAAGLLTVAAALLVPPLRRDTQAVVGWTLAGAVIALVLVTVAAAAVAGRSESHLDEVIDHLPSRLLYIGSQAVLVASAAYAGWHRTGWHSGGRLPAAAAFGGLTLLQGVLLLGLTVTAWLMCTPEKGTALRGLGGPAVALLACALAGVLTGGVAQRVADWLDKGATPGMQGSPIAGPPVLLSWQASVIPVLIVVVALVAAVEARRLWRVTRDLTAGVEADYPGEPHDSARTRQIARARAMAGLTDRTPLLVGVIAAMSFVFGAATLAGAWVSDAVPGQATLTWPWIFHSLAESAQAVGSWLVGAGVVALVTLGRRAYRDAGARRTIGILWDVGTFWPRAAHPFAPPCYAERAVPDLTWRMTTWTRTYGGRIILSGHSQGSVLAAAAAWQLDPRTRGRIALLTYGSPLHRLYGRWFPVYFGREALDSLHADLHAWRNLWRRTDPIGGPVGVRDVDRGPLLDPTAYGRDVDNPLPAPLLAHSDYQVDPAFAAERTMLLVRLPSQDSAGMSSG